MKYFIAFGLALTLFISSSLFNPVEARSGCCSHHGGVCGSTCCDGSALSAKCGGGTAQQVVQNTSIPYPTLAPKKKAVVKKVKAKVTTAPVRKIMNGFICNCKKTCTQMSSCAEAQYQLNNCGCKARDADSDGMACDSTCE